MYIVFCLCRAVDRLASHSRFFTERTVYVIGRGTARMCGVKSNRRRHGGLSDSLRELAGRGPRRQATSEKMEGERASERAFNLITLFTHAASDHLPTCKYIETKTVMDPSHAIHA